jgi:hypothetical protein
VRRATRGRRDVARTFRRPSDSLERLGACRGWSSGCLSSSQRLTASSPPAGRGLRGVAQPVAWRSHLRCGRASPHVAHPLPGLGQAFLEGCESVVDVIRCDHIANVQSHRSESSEIDDTVSKRDQRDRPPTQRANEHPDENVENKYCHQIWTEIVAHSCSQLLTVAHSCSRCWEQRGPTVVDQRRRHHRGVGPNSRREAATGASTEPRARKATRQGPWRARSGISEGACSMGVDDGSCDAPVASLYARTIATDRAARLSR